MCTAVSFITKDHYFGRNLDLDFHYKEAVTITPRHFPFRFRSMGVRDSHFAMIGIATVEDGYPLYYDAINEHGLCMAGLNFPNHACYYKYKPTADNIAPFELIPWVLAQCKSAEDAKQLISHMNLWEETFSDNYPLTPLHWIISDKEKSITIEPLQNGLMMYENHVGVLTNSPPFEYHIYNLSNYLNLTAQIPENRFSENLKLTPYSLGMGGIGLPGDLSSASRFTRAAFTKCNSVCGEDEMSSVTQFFQILASVQQQNGCCVTRNGYEKTIYSSCCNADKGVYYYTTYENRQICAINMHSENLDSDQLIAYDLIRCQQINHIN